MATKKDKKDQTNLAKKVKATTELISSTTKHVAEQVTEKAFVAVGAVKETFGKDVEDLVNWVEKRNQEIKSEHYEVNPDSLPTLAKVITGGEAEIAKLPEDEKKKYTNYFKRNTSRIALLTAINPVVGLGTAGAEMAASGLISTKASVGTTVAGAGIVGASLAASALSPISYIAWSAMGTLLPPLKLIGLGLVAFGSSATLFKSIEKLPQGKLIVAAYDKTQAEYNKCCEKVEANLYAIDKLLSEKMKRAAEALQSTSRKIAVTIDDAVHSDQNMRLMQYQQIVLDQYNSQLQIRKELADLEEQYNAIKLENEKLAKQILSLRDSMQMLVCGSEYLK